MLQVMTPYSITVSPVESVKIFIDINPIKRKGPVEFLVETCINRDLLQNDFKSIHRFQKERQSIFPHNKYLEDFQLTFSERLVYQ